MDRASDAKTRLVALHQPVPKPTRAAVAQNKAEDDSRRETGMVTKLWRNFNKHPDVAQATQVGEPTLVDPKPINASDVVQQTSKAMMGSMGADKNKVSVEAVKNGQPAPNQAPPRSDAPPAVEGATPATPQSDSNELTPNVTNDPSAAPNTAPDPNELKPNVPSDNGQPPAAPGQVNQIQPGTEQTATPNQNGNATGSSQPQDQDEDLAVSSSKHKKKKGLRKMVPF